MSNIIRVSDDGYLLSKSIHKDTIKEEIRIEDLDFDFLPHRKEFGEMVPDVSEFNTSWMINESDKKAILEKRSKFWQEHNVLNDQKRYRAWYITDMCHPYNRRKPDDKFYWYNDIRVLSGSAGIIMVCDGYVWATRAITRS